MLNFLAKLFSRDARRRIFVYSDGERTRRADPMSLQRAIAEHPVWVPARDLPLITKDDEFGREALRDSLQGIRDVFGLKPLSDDGRGLTEDETFGVWNSFIAFCLALKKNIGTPPSLPEHTDSYRVAYEGQKQNSDCGSTASESNTDEPFLSSTP